MYNPTELWWASNHKGATMNAHIDAHDLDTYVTHDYATNNGVRLHYAKIGEGPLVVMLHGFPHFWYYKRL
jgi:hypothetical protein